MKKTSREMLLSIHLEDQAESWIRDNREKVAEVFMNDLEDTNNDEAIDNCCTYGMARIMDFYEKFPVEENEDILEFAKNATWRDVAMFLFNAIDKRVIKTVEKKSDGKKLNDEESVILDSLVLASLVENKESCDNDNLGENNEC